MEIRAIKSAEELREIEARLRGVHFETGVEVITADHPAYGSVILVKNKGSSGRLPEFGCLIIEQVNFL